MSEWGGESVAFFEILQPQCTRRYGDAFGSPTGGCTAILGVTGERKCYNTKATCQDEANYQPQTLVLRFARAQAGLLQYGSGIAGSPAETASSVIPSMQSLAITPAAINLGGMDRSAAALGQREVVTVALQDHQHSDLFVDPYRTERPHSSGSPSLEGFDPYTRGTFWGKWLARNPFHANYPCRVRQGYIGQALDEMEVRNYVIDRVDGPVDGAVKIVAKDLFSKIEERKAVAPTASRGELAADITAAATSAALSPAGIGDLDYPAMPGSPTEFYVAIGDEVIKCTRSGDTLNLLQRGALDTVAEAHDLEDLVQWVLVYASQRAHNIVQDLLTDYSEIPAAAIDSTEWDAQAEQLTELYTARIAAPTPVNDLIGELAEQAGFTIWPDPVTGMIRFTALRARAATPTVTDDGWIVDGTFSSKLQIARRASQVWVYYGQKSPVEDLDERRNFRSRLVVVDADAESAVEYGVPAIREVFSRWIPQNGRAFAEGTANRLISVFRDPPLEAEFAIHVSRDGELELAQFFELEAAEIQDETGAVETTNFAVVELKRGEDDIVVRAQEVSFTPVAGDTGERVIYIENDDYNLNLRTIHDSLYGEPDSGSPSLQVRFIVVDGVIVGSTSAGTAALRVGSWPAGIQVTLENHGRVQGKGGAGANGTALPPNGEVGGTALFADFALRLDNGDGQIWAGGGGGGAVYDTFSGAGSGGGGGAGTDGGNAGASAFTTTQATAGAGTAGGSGASHPVLSQQGGNGGGPGLPGTNASGPGSSHVTSGGAAGEYIDGIANVTFMGSPEGDLRGNVS